MRRSSIILVLSVVLIALVVSSAFAQVRPEERWRLSYSNAEQQANSEQVTAYFQPFGTVSVYAGRFNMTVNEYATAGSTSQLLKSWTEYTYCMDGAYVATPDWYQRIIAGSGLGSVPNVPTLTQGNWDRIAWLARNKGQDSLTSKTKSAGFQLAIWEVLYDGGVNNVDVGGGNFYVTNATADVKSFANAYLTDMRNTAIASGYGNGQVFYVDGQNQLSLSAVPEPMSMILGFMGFGSIAGFKRLSRKR